jgi:hypothetical protein
VTKRMRGSGMRKRLGVERRAGLLAVQLLGVLSVDWLENRSGTGMERGTASRYSAHYAARIMEASVIFPLPLAH